jgi:hypothetical protein
MVPTLTKQEINYLLTTPTDDPKLLKTPVGQQIYKKAIDHAKQQMREGKSPFAP